LATKRDLDATRLAFLVEGRRMLLKQGIPVTISNIRLVDIARNIGRTTGASYNIWAAQEDFHRELAVSICQEADWVEAAFMPGSLDSEVTEGADLNEIIRIISNNYLPTVAASREFLTYIHFWSVSLDEPEVKDAIGKGYEGFQQKISSFYVSLLLQHGREIADPFTVEDYTLTLIALTEGFLLRYSVDPSKVRTGITRPDLRPESAVDWSLFGMAMQHLVQAMTRPITTDRKSSVPASR
jgi:hypothetical protein